MAAQDYVIKDLSLAAWGRKEISMAEPLPSFLFQVTLIQIKILVPMLLDLFLFLMMT